MNVLKLMLNAVPRNAEGGGSPDAGGAGGGAAASAAGGAGDAAGGATAAAGDAAGAGDAGGAAGQGGSVTRPDGVPDNLIGASDQETIAKMAKALSGYRNRDATNHVPEAADGYAAFPDSVPDTIKPHITALKDDPAFGRVATKALEMGVSVPAFQALTQELFSAAADMGVFEPLLDVEAERQALTPEDLRSAPADVQKAARTARMNENFAFVDLLAKGSDPLPQDVADYAKEALGDSAKGHQFIEYVRRMTQGPAGPATGEGSGHGAKADPKADLQRRQALPENTVGHRDFNRESYNKLMQDYQRVHGT